MDNLTSREQDCLRCIYLFRKTNGYSPTFREICVLMNIASTNAARGFVKNLEKKGALKVQRGIARGILIEEKTEQILMESFRGTKV